VAGGPVSFRGEAFRQSCRNFRQDKQSTAAEKPKNRNWVIFGFSVAVLEAFSSHDACFTDVSGRPTQ